MVDLLGLDCVFLVGMQKKEMHLKNASLKSCAQDETRTHTALRPLPPQSSVYTNFTTCASSQLACKKKLAKRVWLAAVVPLNSDSRSPRYF